MKVALSERQKCVLIAFITVFGSWCLYLRFLAPDKDSLLDKYAFLLFFIFFIVAGRIGTNIIKKPRLFELWWVSVFILHGATWVGALVQYALVSKQDRGKWKPIDIILIVIACVSYCFSAYFGTLGELFSK